MLEVATGGRVGRVYIAPHSSSIVCRVTVPMFPPLSVPDGEVGALAATVHSEGCSLGVESKERGGEDNH